MIDSCSVVLFIIICTDLFSISCSCKCLTVCNVFEDRLPDRHSCLNLYPCLIKFSQSVNQSGILSLSFCVCVCLSLSPHTHSHQPTLCVMNSNSITSSNTPLPLTHSVCYEFKQYYVLNPHPLLPTHSMCYEFSSIMSANNQHPQPPTHPVCYEF